MTAELSKSLTRRNNISVFDKIQTFKCKKYVLCVRNSRIVQLCVIVQDMIGVKYITPAELKQYEHALEDIINVVYETT